MRGVTNRAVQYPEVPLKTAISGVSVPIPPALALALAVGAGGRRWIVETSVGEQVGPWQLDLAVRAARTVRSFGRGFGTRPRT